MDNKYIINEDKYYIETESGKKVPLDDLHKEILTITDEIDRLCRKHNIKYFLEAGSALGAYNYGGFIPWDDDVDIAISFDDWDRFVEVMKTELDDDFYFDSYEVDKRFNTIMGPWMKVRKKGTYIEEVNTLLKNRCKRGNGVFVDIIPYGGVAEHKVVDQLERTVIRILMPFIVLFDNLRLNFISVIFKSMVYHFSRFCFKIHKNSKYSSQTISFIWVKFLKEPIFLKEEVFPLKECDFEGRKYFTYNKDDVVLKKWYGNNCLRKWENDKWNETYPKEKRSAKHAKDINLHGDKPSE